MSTQHPDNVNVPFFAEDSILSGEDEIQEAYYAFSHLGCDEQMWDCEGKEVDSFVVKKLLTKYQSFFREKKLGKDFFVTLRVPNPEVEKGEAKILLETLESIPRSFDAANLIYQDGRAPIFEVILPMTTSYKSLNRIYRYYRDFVVGKQDKLLARKDITISQWIGKFKPENINVIPLIEDMKTMLNIYQIIGEYLKDKNLTYQRVFLARSDPAVNYGLLSAVLITKIALQKLYLFSERRGIKIYPIIGVGSAPFRGNLKPQTVEKIIKEYPTVHTFTIQSSFKYDHPYEEVANGIKKIEEKEEGAFQKIDESKALKIVKKYSKEYQKQIIKLAPFINKIAPYVPKRRKRKLHIGLFGYSRSVEEVKLPRAITFTCALYSLGVPPEILGLNALSKNDFKFIKEVYINFEYDLKSALKFLNLRSPFLPKEVKKTLKKLPLDFKIDEENKEITDYISASLKANKNENLSEYILRAANLRKFVG